MIACQLCLPLAVHLVLTGRRGLPPGCQPPAKGLRQIPVLLAIGLEASGAIAMLGFWSSHAGTLVGEAFSFLVILGSVPLVGWIFVRGSIKCSMLRGLAIPTGSRLSLSGH